MIGKPGSASQAIEVKAADGNGRGGMSWPVVSPERYRLYALSVASDLPLLLEPEDSQTATEPDWTIRLGESTDARREPDGRLVAGLRCDGPCHNGAWVTQVYRGPGGTWFWYDATGTYHVAPDGRMVTAFPADGAEERALALTLVGPVATFVAHKLGYPSLHASAVVVDGEAVIFLGPGGQGKSTLAAEFLQHGAPLLTDDVLPLRVIDGVVYGVPSLPSMKLWGETAEHTLGLADELPALTSTVDKKLLRLDERWAFAAAPVPARAVYVLERYDAAAGEPPKCVIAPLQGRSGLAALLAQTSNRAFLQPSENALLLPLLARLAAQAPVRLLHVPHGFEHQERVYTAIMNDLEA